MLGLIIKPACKGLYYNEMVASMNEWVNVNVNVCLVVFTKDVLCKRTKDGQDLIFIFHKVRENVLSIYKEQKILGVYNVS